LPHMVENMGSNARDFCMLERNLLSHLKLALLLSLLSSSILLRARLVPDAEGIPEPQNRNGIPLAVIQIVASIAAIIAGVWEYHSGYKDLRNMRAFLVATNPHLAIMTVVVGVVFATCIVLLAE
ncbi:hypothetical protein BDZ94DRAFT_1141336, partial [Collybia nuda]